MYTKCTIQYRMVVFSPLEEVFRAKNLQDTGIDDVFFLEKSCRKMYTIFSAVQRQQRKSDV
jgi:hypothetical protein